MEGVVKIKLHKGQRFAKKNREREELRKRWTPPKQCDKEKVYFTCWRVEKKMGYDYEISYV